MRVHMLSAATPTNRVPANSSSNQILTHACKTFTKSTMGISLGLSPISPLPPRPHLPLPTPFPLPLSSPCPFSPPSLSLKFPPLSFNFDDSRHATNRISRIQCFQRFREFRRFRRLPRVRRSRFRMSCWLLPHHLYLDNIPSVLMRRDD